MLGPFYDKTWVFCGDVERPNDFGGRNLRWFDLMTQHFPAKERIRLDKPPKQLTIPEWERTYFNNPDSYNIKEITRLIDEKGRGNIFVLGYEIPVSLLEFLQTNGVMHIAIAVSPIRFCPDIYLSARSNVLSLSGVEDKEFVFYAQCLKARRSRTMVNDLRPNTTLIVGQSPSDSSLLARKENGEGYTVTINETGWEKLPGHKIFKPHPGNTKQQLPGVNVVNANIYDLFCMDEITTVVGISSSCLDEAECFGKKVIRRLPCPCSRPTGYIPIRPEQLFGMKPQSKGFFRDVHWAGHPCPKW